EHSCDPAYRRRQSHPAPPAGRWRCADRHYLRALYGRHDGARRGCSRARAGHRCHHRPADQPPRRARRDTPARLRDRCRQFPRAGGNDDAGDDPFGGGWSAAAAGLIWNIPVAFSAEWNIHSVEGFCERTSPIGRCAELPSENKREDQMKKTILTLAASLAIFAGVAAPAAADGERFVLVSHAPDSDSWWNTIKNAINVAGQQMGVTVEYRNPPTGDLADMARIIEQATASSPNGIISTIADFDVLSGPLSNAVAQGIPVITINSGTEEQSKQIGALMHVGQPEKAAGFGAGEKAKAAGVTKFLCVNHYITNPASVERCQGYADALGVELGNQMIDAGQDPAEI